MGKHVHSMAPHNGAGMASQSVYKCGSCEFRCTKRSLGVVSRSTRAHHIVRKTDAEAKVVYDVHS